MKKKTIAALLILGLLISGGRAFAEKPTVNISEAGATRYVVINTITPKLSVSGTTATYSLSVDCATTVTSISATLQIQKLGSNGVYANYGSSWTVSSTSPTLRTSGTKTVDKDGTYRLKVTVTAYYSGGSETVTAYS